MTLNPIVGDDQLLVVEYAPHGSLSDAFIAFQDGTLRGANGDALLSTQHIVAILQQINSGMEALAAAKINHCDLAARNVLLFNFDPEAPDATSVKVCDFGLSVAMYGKTHATVQGESMDIIMKTANHHLS